MGIRPNNRVRLFRKSRAVYSIITFSSYAVKMIMNFDGVGSRRKEEMFFNIVMPFFIVIANDVKIVDFLRFLFENHPPLEENSLTKKFREKFSEIRIKTVKEYMASIYYLRVETGEKSC